MKAACSANRMTEESTLAEVVFGWACYGCSVPKE